MRASAVNMDTFLMVCACLALMTGGGEASITVVEAPGVQVAENGTVDAIVLDCPFTLEPNDHTGLVIKWFHSKQRNPIYQWIPGNPAPQALGLLKGRVDLQYEASPDYHHRHRALRILQPTTDLTGDYTCVISSFQDEKTYTQKLVIYSEPEEVKVWTEQRDDRSVTVLCHVSHVYPQPQLHLRQHSTAADSVVLSSGQVTSSQGLYNLTMEQVVDEETLEGPTTFECQVTIPDTEVQVLRSTLYQPRVKPLEGAVRGGVGDERPALTLLAALALLALGHM